MKIYFSKHKQQIISASPKLSTSNCISEDIPPYICHPSRKLLAFGKSQELHYKMRFDKFYAGDTGFVYDSVDDCIKESKLSIKWHLQEHPYILSRRNPDLLVAMPFF